MKKFIRRMTLLATLALAPLFARLPRGASYWQSEDGEVTMKLEPCIERGLCVSVYALNPDDPRVQKMSGDLRGEEPSPESARSFCGYMLGTALLEKEDGNWAGTLTSSTGKTVSLKLTFNDEGRMEARGYKLLPLLGKSFFFHQVPKPAAACKVVTS